MERLKLVLVIFASLSRHESCRSTHERLRPTKIQYRSYKKFNEADFLRDITDPPFDKCLKIRDSKTAYDSFKDTFLSITNKHAPLKANMNRGNQAPFMAKELSKQIMIRSRLRNKSISIGRENIGKTMYASETNARVYIGKPSKGIFQNSVRMVLSGKQNVGPPLSLS